MSGAERARITHAARGWHEMGRRFWSGEGGATNAILGFLLLPVELAYRGIIAARNLAYDRNWLRTHRADVSVVSVGNLAVGGTGKTPFARWLVDRMIERGLKPAVLHGGYAEDEPALHRAWHPGVPVVVGRDRTHGAREAARQGADVAILDDGFQHRRLRRDVDLVLIAAEDFPERIRLLPRGPWREPLSSLRRANAIVVTRRTASLEQAEEAAVELRRHQPGVPIVVASIRPAGWRRGGAPAEPPHGPVVAVAAIAQPQLFLQNVLQVGTRVEELFAYPDHHAFTRSEIDGILRAAAGRPIVTTAKDAVKLSDLIAETDVWILEQNVEIEAGETELDRLLGNLTS